MVECKNCKYFISFDEYRSISLGKCSIILPPWLENQLTSSEKTVYSDEFCSLGIEEAD